MLSPRWQNAQDCGRRPGVRLVLDEDERPFLCAPCGTSWAACAARRRCPSAVTEATTGPMTGTHSALSSMGRKYLLEFPPGKGSGGQGHRCSPAWRAVPRHGCAPGSGAQKQRAPPLSQGGAVRVVGDVLGLVRITCCLACSCGLPFPGVGGGTSYNGRFRRSKRLSTGGGTGAQERRVHFCCFSPFTRFGAA